MSDGILSRWARRKQAVRAAERTEARPPVEPDASPAVTVEAKPTAADADALAEAIARLPNLDDLTAETDLTPFLRIGIPSVLRNAALRKMWSVDPSIRDFVSEAREYAYDWNTPGGVPGLGPMLPTDDIKAMVERIMGGPTPVPATVEPATAATEMVEVPAVPTEGTEPVREPVIAHVEPAALNPSPEPTDAFQSPTIVPRLRRHGGALPT